MAKPGGADDFTYKREEEEAEEEEAGEEGEEAEEAVEEVVVEAVEDKEQVVEVQWSNHSSWCALDMDTLWYGLVALENKMILSSRGFRQLGTGKASRTVICI